MKCIAVLLFVLGLGLGCVAGANAQPTPPDTVPTMTIKVFNDDPTHYAFPVFTAAPHDKFDDVWLQAIFKITKQQVDSQKFGYHTKLSYRFYINPTNGIAPGGNVVLTIPLYTQLVNNPDPAAFDQYIDWWNGVRLEVFYATSSAQPRAFTDDLTNRSQCNPNPCQQSLDLSQNKLPAGALIPICKTDTGGDCETLQFFSDVTNLPKSDPSQLLEMTLGARIDLQPVKTPATDPPNALDLRNVDFDVSYVNDAYGPAAMGPFENDQVGYVGTPQSVTTFESAINQFLTDFAGWPQYIRLFDTDPKKVPVLKLPSPLEILARIIPNSLAPPDLTPLDPSKGQHWPDKLWDPVQALRDNWVDYAGKATDPALGPKCKGKNRIGEKSFCN